MPVLIVEEGGEVTQETWPLDPEAITNAVEDDIAVYRFHEGKFQQFTPVDETDLDNWSDV